MNRHETATSAPVEQANNEAKEQDRHPDFDARKLGQRIEDIHQKLETDSQAEDAREIISLCSSEFSGFTENSPHILEKNPRRSPRFEKILNTPEALRIIHEDYIKQYEFDSDTHADSLYTKDQLDHYVLGQLKSEHAQEFYQSDEFRNYAKFIFSLAQNNSETIGSKKYYPEFTTNPILRNPKLRYAVVSRLGYQDGGAEVFKRASEAISAYTDTMKDISGRLEKREKASQSELDATGNYLYQSRDFDNPIAQRFASYLFTDARKRNDLKPSVQMFGALANYCAHEDTLDARLRESRTYIANYSQYIPSKKKYYKVNVGVSSSEYCVLEQNLIAKINLKSEAGLSKSRFNRFGDLYSFIMVAFHELTHDYQKLMMADGKINSSSMSYILNAILRKNQSKCFTPVDSERRPIRDKDGRVLEVDYYKANHDSDEIEIQADEEAWRQCRKFIHKHEIRPFQGSDETKRKEGREHWEKCLEREREVSARRAFCLKGDEFGNDLSYIQYDIRELKKYISNNPDTLKRYPQLESYFDSKGNIRPDIFFNQRIAAIDYAAFDAQTDNFGVELATYAITDETTTKLLLEYIKNNPLSSKQALRCTSNLWNILHQDALKMRAIKKVDYSSYDYTHTRGVDISVPDLRKSYLKQYLHQLYSCVRVSYALKKRCPDASSKIAEDESKYFSAYYSELAKDVKLEPSYSSKVKARYMESKQPALQNIARSMV